MKNLKRSVNLARAFRALNCFTIELFDSSSSFESSSKNSNNFAVADVVSGSSTQILQEESAESPAPKKDYPSTWISEESKSSFEGSLFGMKDVFCTKGIPTTCCSEMLRGFVPPYDATVVEKLKRAGGILFGKTNHDEFSMGSSSTQSCFGPVKNPYSLKLELDKDPNLSPEDVWAKMESDWIIPGGSSGGSAVVVAMGFCRIALGSDTGGSVRNPAAFCGVVGLKPTYGLVSRHGLIPLVNSLDVPGIISKNVTDAAIALMSDEVWEAWNEVGNWLEAEGGCEVSEVSLPNIHYSILCYHVLGECEVASNMARYDGVEYGYRPDEDGESLNRMYARGRYQAFNELVRRRILAGNYFLLKQNYEEYFVQAMKIRRLISEDFFRVLRGDGGVDILLTPVTSTDAPLYSEFSLDDGGYSRERQDDYFTQPVNMAGVPAVSVPVKLSRRGLPISLQLISDSFNEAVLFQVAKWIETRAQFPALDVDQLLEKFGTRCNLEINTR